MNIVIANAFWDEEVPGGSYRISSDFARYLARKGHHVHYLSATFRSHGVEGELRNGIHFWQYPISSRPGSGLSRLVSHFWAPSRLAKKIRQFEPIHILNGHSQIHYAGPAAILKKGTLRCFSSHSPLPDEMESNEKGILKVWISTLLERKLIQWSHVVQSFSEFEASLLVQRYGDWVKPKQRVIPGWVNETRFSKFASQGRNEVRKKMGPEWFFAGPIFLSIRRLVPRMGLENLLEAVRLLDAKGLEFLVLIGGDGPSRDSLYALARSLGVNHRVRFLERLPEDDLPMAYRAADCVLLPSRSLECFGLTILEAYSAGTPVIATPVGAIPEVMEAASKSWMTKNVSPSALADRMEAFLKGELHADEARLRTHAHSYDIEIRAAAWEKWLVERDLTCSLK